MFPLKWKTKKSVKLFGKKHLTMTLHGSIYFNADTDPPGKQILSEMLLIFGYRY